MERVELRGRVERVELQGVHGEHEEGGPAAVDQFLRVKLCCLMPPSVSEHGDACGDVTGEYVPQETPTCRRCYWPPEVGPHECADEPRGAKASTAWLRYSETKDGREGGGWGGLGTTRRETAAPPLQQEVNRKTRGPHWWFSDYYTHRCRVVA